MSAPAPSATVVLTRDARDGVEVLLLRRNSRLAFHGGAWVFPGGRIDAADWTGGSDEIAAARRAAVREAAEEASLALEADDLVPFARWTTPPAMPKRFRTWFFAAAVTDTEVTVDGGEIHDHRWMTPERALEAQRAGEIELPPPTFVTITMASAARTARDAVTALAAPEMRVYTPRMTRAATGLVSLYEEDAGYTAGDLDAPGARHRLWMLTDGWRYERGF